MFHAQHGRVAQFNHEQLVLAQRGRERFEPRAQPPTAARANQDLARLFLDKLPPRRIEPRPVCIQNGESIREMLCRDSANDVVIGPREPRASGRRVARSK
jgi:hypothetical protein